MLARPATPDDLPMIHDVAAGYVDLDRWPSRPDYLDHELEHGRLVVAEDHGLILGFGASFERSGRTYLADLFVLPDRLGTGIGGAILREVFAEPGERFTFASSDPRSRPLYVRHGMQPLGPLLYLGADATTAGRLPDPGVSLAEATLSDVVDLDARASGRKRPQDLEFLGSVGSYVMGGGAYGYVRVVGDEALLNPTGASHPDGLSRMTIALLRHASTMAPVVRVAAMETHPALPTLLDAGFRVEESDTYMASRPDLVDGTRYGPSPVIG